MTAFVVSVSRGAEYRRLVTPMLAVRLRVTEERSMHEPRLPSQSDFVTHGGYPDIPSNPGDTRVSLCNLVWSERDEMK